MEIRINKEIKDYHESLFFGLSTRQFICSVAAVGAAVGIYFRTEKLYRQRNGILALYCGGCTYCHCRLFQIQRYEL